MVGEIRDREDRRDRRRGFADRHLGALDLTHQQRRQTITRLLDMGMDPLQLATPGRRAAQRLVRRCCSQCQTRAARWRALNWTSCWNCHVFPNDARVHWGRRARSNGVTRMRTVRTAKFVRYQSHRLRRLRPQRATQGRASLHELLRHPGIRRQIQTGARAEIHTALGDGLRTLRQDGILKGAAKGITTLAEVRASATPNGAQRIDRLMSTTPKPPPALTPRPAAKLRLGDVLVSKTSSRPPS